jgi:hypothetical protein
LYPRQRSRGFRSSPSSFSEPAIDGGPGARQRFPSSALDSLPPHPSSVRRPWTEAESEATKPRMWRRWRCAWWRPGRKRVTSPGGRGVASTTSKTRRNNEGTRTLGSSWTGTETTGGGKRSVFWPDQHKLVGDGGRNLVGSRPAPC